MIHAKELSSYVNRAYRLMKRVYVERGYFASGSIGVEDLCSIHQDPEKIEIIIDGLLESGKVQIRKEFHALAFELTVEERLKLIKEHDLVEEWEDNLFGLAASDYNGEIFKVVQAVKEKRKSKKQRRLQVAC